MIPSLVHLREHAFVSGNLEGELQLGTVSHDLIDAILGKIHEPAEIRSLGRMLAANDDHEQLGEDLLARAETLMTAARAMGLEKEAQGGFLGTVARIEVAENTFGSFELLLTDKCLPGLTFLDIRNCGITNARMLLLSDAILQGRLASCTEINLRSNGINDADMQSFSMAIAKTPLPRLGDLDLGNNQIGDVGLTAFATALHSKALPLLKDLQLWQNKIGDAGMEAFAEAGSEGYMAKLGSLTLHHNHIGDTGMVAFAAAVRSGKLPALRLVSLTRNEGNAAVVKEALVALHGSKNEWWIA